MKGIADTGFLVAFASRTDRFHEWAMSVAARLTEPLLTCEAVLSETAFHLGSVRVVVEMVETGLVSVSFNAGEHLAQLAALARRYEDRAPDFADLCLVRMSELHPRHSVVTVDGDFHVYRRNKREVIPVICPPGT